MERNFAWLSRFRRLARDWERLAAVLAGFRLIAFEPRMLRQAAPAMGLLRGAEQDLVVSQASYAG